MGRLARRKQGAPARHATRTPHEKKREKAPLPSPVLLLATALSQFNAGLRDPSVKRLVVDGTGTNVERQIRRMTQAREAGFFVKAMYVRVPERTAIARAAMRKTGVTPSRIRMYQTKMANAMAVASEHADEVEIVDVTFDDAPQPGTMQGTCVDPHGVTAVAH